MYSNKAQRKSKKKLFFIIAGVLVAVALLVIALEKTHIINLYTKSKPVSSTPTETGNSNVNLEPPTEQELNETAAHKEALASQKQTSPSPAFGKTRVNPVITNADQTTVRAYIPVVAEDGGKCSATFTQGASSFTKQSSGFNNLSNTICEPITINESEFANRGKWTVVLNYESANAAGSSQPYAFEVD